jgi:hypothetical protein
MELDPKFICAPEYSCTHWLRPATPPSPLHLGSYTRALLVSQDRRHLFVTPCVQIESRGRIFSPFMQMYFTLRSFNLTPASDCPLVSLILLYVSQHRSLTAISQKKLPLTNWLSIETHVIGRFPVRPTCAQYLNKRSHGQSLRSTVGQAEPIAQFSLKFDHWSHLTMYWRLYTHTLQYVTSIYIYL